MPSLYYRPTADSRSGSIPVGVHRGSFHPQMERTQRDLAHRGSGSFGYKAKVEAHMHPGRSWKLPSNPHCFCTMHLAQATTSSKAYMLTETVTSTAKQSAWRAGPPTTKLLFFSIIRSQLQYSVGTGKSRSAIRRERNLTPGVSTDPFLISKQQHSRFNSMVYHWGEVSQPIGPQCHSHQKFDRQDRDSVTNLT